MTTNKSYSEWTSPFSEWTTPFEEEIKNVQPEQLKGVTLAFPKSKGFLSSMDKRPRELYLNSHAIAFTSDALSLKSIQNIFNDLKKAAEEVGQHYARLSELVMSFSDISGNIIDMVMEADTDNDPDPKSRLLILRYFIKGKCTDRFGEEIVKPEGDLRSEYFTVGLDIGRILLQREIERKTGLLWLAKSSNELKDVEKAHKFWESHATKLSNPLIGAGISAGLAAIPTLSDNASKAASMVIGVTCSKTVESLVAKAIEQDPDKWIDRMKLIEAD
jgi:hypothetical protein